MAFETGSTVTRLREEALPARPRPSKVKEVPPSPSTEAISPPEPSLEAVLTAAFAGVGMALSARALLLLAIVGGFVLAMRQPSNLALIELGIYGAVVVIPVALLEYFRGR